MKSYFKELFEYNHHCNAKLSEIFVEKTDVVSEKSIQLLSHVFNAHHIWLHRIKYQQPQSGVWDMHTVQQFKEINEENFDETTNLLNHVDLNKIISYQNSKGQKFQNKIGDILFHIINHSTYHRGQIATDFRENGIAPLITDYIFWKRETP
ncbi:MAG: hypothetical protein M9904_13970 [Chitinophagaceae bacterium]|nr:hypothetical protein [Chitinophagaceae bacterium]MCO5241153.1 hypothetical protein [Chitinophagaceae bacterium]